MAEAFARAYGADVIIPASAGLAPAMRVPGDTRNAMNEKGIDLRDHFPKGIRNLGRAEFDLVVNMSGSEILPEQDAQVYNVMVVIGRGYRAEDLRRSLQHLAGAGRAPYARPSGAMNADRFKIER